MFQVVEYQNGMWIALTELTENREQAEADYTRIASEKPNALIGLKVKPNRGMSYMLYRSDN